jgi:signal transduction histidine kinase
MVSGSSPPNRKQTNLERFTAPSKRLVDPEDQRRSRLLNIVLLGLAFIDALAVIGTFAIYGFFPTGTEFLLAAATTIGLVALLVIYLFNRAGYNRLASWLLLVFLVVGFALSDSPDQVIGGRTLFMFSLPVLLASLILPSYNSFLVALVVDILLISMGRYYDLPVSIAVILGFLALAFISWLASRTLEQTVQELRDLNAALDKRVVERTIELQFANEKLIEQADALEVARDEALKASLFKSRMLANVSHELRTPLGAILGFTEMMMIGYLGPVTDKQKTALEKIGKRVSNLTLLVSDLLDQAKLESGTIALHNRLWQPVALVAEVEEMLKEKAKPNVELKTTIDPDLPDQIFGDSNRIQQILLNLGGNALKFTEDGEVSIALYPTNQSCWAIDVTDTGPGIPAEELETIFEAFQQVDGSTTRRHAGFGLGLSIVEQLARAMGGDVRVESVVGQGSKFTVMIPLLANTADKKVDAAVGTERATI